MRKISIYLVRYLLWSFPAVVVIAAWCMLQGQEEVIRTGSKPVVIVWEILSWNCMLWFIALASIFILLLASRGTREELLTRLAGVKERDERERFITGSAARFTFFATLAMMLFLLFASTLYVRITRLDPAHAIDGRRTQLTLGFALGDMELKPADLPDAGQDIVSVHGVNLPNEVILLFLIAWQFGCFRYASGREGRE